MAVRCVIGLRTNDGIKAVVLYNEGNISQAGVLLNMFYQEQAKVVKLLNKGDIKNLGIREDCSNMSFKDTSSMDLCYYINQHLKTSFTRYALNGTTSWTFKGFEEMMFTLNLHFGFIYDISRFGLEKGSKWAVVGARRGRNIEQTIVCCVSMDKIIKSVEPLTTLMKWVGGSPNDAENEWLKIQTKIEYFKKLTSVKNIDVCKDWLQMLQGDDFLRSLVMVSNKENKIKEIEFGYSNTQADGRMYAVYQKLQPGQSKRKRLYSSKDLNEVLLFVCEYCGINPYGRPIFTYSYD